MATTTTALVKVSCTRLRSGEWGVRSSEEIVSGDRVLARTLSGQEWPVIVDRVVWTDGRVWIASTRRAERASEPTVVVTAVAEPVVAAPTATEHFEPIFRDCGRRPRPVVTEVTPAQLATWDPTKRETHYEGDVAGFLIRNGEQFAIVRPGVRFPLGHSSDHRRVVSHNATRAAIMSGPVAAEQVEPGKCYIAGPGYFTAQTFEVRHMHVATVAGVDVTHQLVVTNDHTGAGSMRASLVCYVGLDAVGAVAVAKGRHVASSPERWQSAVDAMIETAILSQDEILDLLTRAQAHVLTDEDRKWLRKRDVIVRRSAKTALDAFRAWHEGNGKARPTWGVWARRLDSKGLEVLRAMLERVAAEKAEKPSIVKAA